jgi:shikimate dehydrogenase
MRAPTAATRLFLLLGDPVAHSLSPVFQNAAIRYAGIDAVYAALRCDRQSIAPLIRALCRANGGGNVTLPHKAAAAECIEEPSTAVRRTGVCNTFWGEDGVIRGDNTDVEGFRVAAQRLVPALVGRSVLIVGAGGAAAAAICALLDAAVASIILFNRSPDRARSLATRFDPDAHVVSVVTSMNDVAGVNFDLVVNATPIGPTPAARPVDLSSLGTVAAALDLTYAQGGGETPWVRHARSVGVRAADGTDMLLAQGAAAFTCWFGTEPSLDLMRDAIAAGTH